MMKNKKILVVVVAALIIIGTIGYATNLPYTWPVLNLTIRSQVKNMLDESHKKYLFVTPETLPIAIDPSSIREGEGQAYTYQGREHQFKTPWRLITKEVVRPGTVYQFSFEGDRKIGIHLVSGKPLDLDLGKDPRSMQALEDLRQLVGDQATLSRYLYMEQVFRATPNDIKLFTNPRKNAAYYALLVTKGVYGGDAEEIYQFQGTIQGFQIGDPETTTDPIRTLIYPSENDEILVAFYGDDITQNDINYVLSSL